MKINNLGWSCANNHRVRHTTIKFGDYVYVDIMSKNMHMKLQNMFQGRSIK